MKLATINLSYYFFLVTISYCFFFLHNDLCLSDAEQEISYYQPEDQEETTPARVTVVSNTLATH